MNVRDRWGDDDYRMDRDQTTDGTSWALISLVLALLLLGAAAFGGWMYLKATQMQRIAAMERAMVAQQQESIARAEMERKRLEETERQVEKGRALLERRNEIEKEKNNYFPGHEDAIAVGRELETHFAKPAEADKVNSFIGKEAVFLGSASKEGELELGLGNGIRLRIQPRSSDIKPPKDLVWFAFVLGKIVSIDHNAKVITVEAKPENWKLYQPKDK